MASPDTVRATAVARREVRNSLARLEYHLGRGVKGIKGVNREVAFLDALHRQTVAANGSAVGRAYTGRGSVPFGQKALAAFRGGNAATIGRVKSSLLADFSANGLQPARDAALGMSGGWVWVANGSACPTCLLEHGEVYPETLFFTPLHPSCLCIPLPAGTPGIRRLSDREVVNTWSQYGDPRYARSMRGFQDGTVTRESLRSVEAVNRTSRGFQAVRDHYLKGEAQPLTLGTGRPVSRGGTFNADDAIETFDHYRDALTGDWTAERAAFHDRLIAEYLQGYEAHSNPTLFMTGGGPASGKSTMVKARPHLFPSETGVSIDADAIKRLLPEYNDLVAAGDLRAAALVHEESSYLSKRILAEAYKRDLDVLYDSVGDSGIVKLGAKIDDARDAGQRVIAHYASNDLDLALDLARKRAIKTGREVPYDYIRAAHADVTDTFIDAVRLGKFDEGYLWDTNIKGEARAVMEYLDGKVTILDDQLWADFVSKGSRSFDDVTQLLDDVS